MGRPPRADACQADGVAAPRLDPEEAGRHAPPDLLEADAARHVQRSAHLRIRRVQADSAARPRARLWREGPRRRLGGSPAAAPHGRQRAVAGADEPGSRRCAGRARGRDRPSQQLGRVSRSRPQRCRRRSHRPRAGGRAKRRARRASRSGHASEAGVVSRPGVGCCRRHEQQWRWQHCTGDAGAPVRAEEARAEPRGAGQGDPLDRYDQPPPASAPRLRSVSLCMLTKLMR